MSKIYKEVNEKYAEACSTQTICSMKKGFFFDFCDAIVDMAKVNNWLDTVLRQQNNDADRIRVIRAHQEVWSNIERVVKRIHPMFWEKDIDRCKEKIKNCVKAILMKKLNASLNQANSAVIFATTPDTAVNDYSLVTALWIRAEILLLMGHYDLAYRDLKLVLRYGLNNNLKAEYYWKMGDIYRGLNNITAAKTSYNIALQLFGSKDEKIKDIIKQSLVNVNNNVYVPLHPIRHSAFDAEIKVTLGPRENSPALSKLVKIIEKEGMGRFAVAERHVKTGATLLIEEPFASCLEPELMGTHCSLCYKRLEAPIGCEHCIGAVFCDEECREKAKYYHKYECTLENFMFGSGMSILSRLALRMVTQVGLQGVRNIHAEYLTSDMKPINPAMVNDIEGNVRPTRRRSRQERNNKRRQEESGKDVAGTSTAAGASNIGSQDKTAAIYSLCIHSEAREPKDFIERFMMATFLKECLTRTQFFDKTDKEVFERDENIVVEVLIRNLQILQFNAHMIHEVLRSKDAVDVSKVKYVAAGVYPTAALFNHDCYPSVARFYRGKCIVLRTTRPIAAGDIVAENYGANFLTYSVEQRRKDLACRYWFECKCKPCIENWPGFRAMRGDDLPMVRCPNAACDNNFVSNMQGMPTICDKCKHQLPRNVMKRNTKLAKEAVLRCDEATIFITEELIPDNIIKLCTAIDLYHSVGAVPYKTTHLAEEALRSCFSRYGNHYFVTLPLEDEELPLDDAEPPRWGSIGVLRPHQTPDGTEVQAFNDALLTTNTDSDYYTQASEYIAAAAERIQRTVNAFLRND